MIYRLNTKNGGSALLMARVAAKVHQELDDNGGFVSFENGEEYEYLKTKTGISVIRVRPSQGELNAKQ